MRQLPPFPICLNLNILFLSSWSTLTRVDDHRRLTSSGTRCSSLLPEWVLTSSEWSSTQKSSRTRCFRSKITTQLLLWWQICRLLSKTFGKWDSEINNCHILFWFFTVGLSKRNIKDSPLTFFESGITFFMLHTFYAHLVHLCTLVL